MKAVMYHYVRPDSGGMPFFRYLSLGNFKKQLDYFEETFGFVSKADFLSAVATGRCTSDGIVLTFDDGLADHIEFVLPELVRRGVWGLFYIPTGHYASQKMLDVHRVHILLGHFGGAKLLEAIGATVSDNMIRQDDVTAFRNVTYKRQDNDEATNAVKRAFNYYISYDYRSQVLDQLMKEFFGDREPALRSDYYLDDAQIIALHRAGMIVGPHSETHPVMSRLDEASQRREIANSFGYLENVVGDLGCRTFCHPYGGFHSFNDTTERLLSEYKCQFAFNVEQRDIASSDLTNRPQALPRYDCNQFPHGAASLGDSR